MRNPKEIMENIFANLVQLNETLRPIFELAESLQPVFEVAQFPPPLLATPAPGGVTTTALPAPPALGGVGTVVVTMPKRKPGRPRKRVRPAPAQAAPPELATVSVGLTSPEEPVQAPYKLNIPKLEEPVDVIMAPQAPPASKVASPARQFQGKWMAATRKLSDADKVQAKLLRGVNPEAALLWAQGRTA